MIATLFVIFMLAMFIGIPVAISLGVTSLAILFSEDISLMIIPQRMFAGCDSFPLVAIPFFMLAGDLLSSGKMSAKLVQFAESFLGFIKGGLWMVAVMASAFFAAISGSSAATTAAVGAPLIPELNKRGYSTDQSAALVAAGGCIGVIIPPSVPMVLYAVIADQSVNALFLNGILPGILMALALAGVALFIAHKNNYSKGVPLSFKNIWRTFQEAIWALLMPLIILGGIFSGLFTATESAVIAVVYSIIVSVFVYKDLTWKKFTKIVVNSAITMAVVMFIISTSAILSWIMANWQIPNQIAAALLGLSSNKYVIMFLILIITLIAGVFMETSSALIILTPVFLPLLVELNVNLVHFGVVMVLSLAIGMITPPVAICLYVASTTSGISIERISKAVVPFLLALVGVLLVYTYVPMLIPSLIL